MEVLAEEGVTSFPEINDLSLTMRRLSRFFVGMEKSELQILTDLLEDLNSFLEDADSKSVEKLMKESVNCWLEQTKDSKEFKGLVEEDCFLKLSKVMQERRIVNFLTRVGRRFAKLAAYQNRPSMEDTASSSIAAVEPQYVDSVARDVILRLTEGDSRRSVVSLVGPRGIGKTTIARRVYESETVKDRFDCRCWIDVSGSYSFQDLQKFIIENIRAVQAHVGEFDGKSLFDLVEILRKSLQSKRYLFVFDDLYLQEFWVLINHSLPENCKGSRIIITAPSSEVFNSVKQTGSFVHVLNLDPLSREMALDLFSKVVFQDEPEMCCPKELKQLSLDIIGLCEGFPLRILRVGGLLSKQPKTLSTWLNVAYRFKRELETTTSPPNVSAPAIFRIDLPYHLRRCFLYISMFPMNSLIPRNKLFMLWISEGFIENKIGKSLEEVAEEYLNELVVMDLVESCHAFDEFGQLCKVNAVIHFNARAEARGLNFFQVWDGINSSGKSGSHRLWIRDKANIVLDDIDSQVRSIFLSGAKFVEFSIGSLIKKCGDLTMLDFEDYPIEHFPEELSRLSNLKYLCLKNTKVNKLPKSIQKMQKLESLDCRNTRLTELPVGINKLKNLRHLLASDYENNGVTIKEGFGALVNLHALMTAEVHFGIFKELAKLKQLRKLGISGLSAETFVALCTCIDFGHLEFLMLRAMANNGVLDLRVISPSLPRLKSLVLKGRLPMLPSWVFPLQNLKFLCLSLSRLTNDPMKDLSLLPNLESLWLYRSYVGEQLYFEEGRFVKLKILVIRELRGLNVLEIEDGALPLLEELRIGSSPLLNEVPIGIRKLRNLKVLANYDMPKEFVVSMQPNGGADFWKVEHIASVVFLYRVQGQDYQLFKLGDSELRDHLLGLDIRRANIVQHSHEHGLSFSESDYEEDDVVGRLNFSADPWTIPLKDSRQRSFSSSFFSDDIEE